MIDNRYAANRRFGRIFTFQNSIIRNSIVNPVIILKHKDFLEVEKVLLAKKPGTKRLNFKLANLYYEMGFLELSLYYYDKSIFKFELEDSELADVFLDKRLEDLSKKLSSQSYIVEAQATLDKYPKHWASYSNLGNAYDAFKMYEDAMQSYQEAFRLNPTSDLVNFKLGENLYYKAKELLDASDLENARTNFYQAKVHLDKINKENLDSFIMVDLYIAAIPTIIDNINKKLGIFELV